MVLKKIFFFLLFLYFQIFNSAFANISVTSVEPKAFGYVLGDVFERRFILKSTSEPIEIIENTDDKIGRIDTWFSVVNIKTVKLSSYEYEVSVKYQVINIPSKPLMIEVPEYEFFYYIKNLKSSVKSSRFLMTVAPVIPNLLSNRGGLSNLQPDDDIGKIPTEIFVNRIIFFGLLSLIPTFILCYCWLPFHRIFSFKKLPFNYGKRCLLKIKTKKNEEFWNEGFNVFHNALNSTFKKSIFLYSIDHELKKNNIFISLLPEFKYFLQLSQKFFYEKKNVIFTQKDKTRFFKLFENASLIEKGLS